MSLPANATEIIRCLKADGYTPAQGAKYARTIAAGCLRNPWAEPSDGPAYDEAALRLEAEAILNDQAAAILHPTDP